eukprot:scpid60404/ scgid12493/ Vacuolar protein sorting-associated protein 33A
MSQNAGYLSNGRVDIGLLRQSLRAEFVECLTRCDGSKAIVWDDQLTSPFTLVTEYALLKAHGVDKMYPLRRGALPSCEMQHIIFLTRPHLPNMEMIADNIRAAAKDRLKEFSVFFIPRKTMLCERRLEELGVYGNLTNIDEYNLDILPVDSDLLSLEQPLSFRECYLEQDYTSLFYVARSLMTLQALYGTIPNLIGKGVCSRQVIDMILRMRRESTSLKSSVMPQIDNLILVDRSTDLLTPMLSQLTYEGLIDEIFGIQNCSVKLPPEKFLSSEQEEKNKASGVVPGPKVLVLNSGDEMFGELRDLNYQAVGPLLSRRAKRVTSQMDERHEAKTVRQLKQFVNRLPHLQSMRQAVSTHTSIAELIKEQVFSDDFMNTLRAEQELIGGVDTDKVHPLIETLIAKKAPIVKVLRLLCIHCISNNGFKAKLMDFYKREIIQTYGMHHMITLDSMEKVGLLFVKTTAVFTQLRKSLRLSVDNVDEVNPQDISYVYSGYAPISVRIAQNIAKPGGLRNIEALLRLLPGPLTEEKQSVPVGLQSKKAPSAAGMTLIFFLGGMTHAEVSALRFLASEDGLTDYLIATTQMINGTSLIETLVEKNPLGEDGDEGAAAAASAPSSSGR